MRRLILVLAVAALVAPAAAAAPLTGDSQAIERLVVPCRVAARAALRGDWSVGDRYLERLLKDQRQRQPEIIACGAYLTAINDVLEGRLVPVDPN